MCTARCRAVALGVWPQQRLLADQTAKALAGISDALNGMALLVAAPVSPVPPGRGFRLRVPDWLPALVSAGRAFVAIGIVELFWIAAEWPNGALAITFTANLCSPVGAARRPGLRGRHAFHDRQRLAR
jgi:uncharacterized membrane protein YccC